MCGQILAKEHSLAIIVYILRDLKMNQNAS
jgi:hypothetical protein